MISKARKFVWEMVWSWRVVIKPCSDWEQGQVLMKPFLQRFYFEILSCLGIGRFRWYLLSGEGSPQGLKRGMYVNLDGRFSVSTVAASSLVLYRPRGEFHRLTVIICTSLSWDLNVHFFLYNASFFLGHSGLGTITCLRAVACSLILASYSWCCKRWCWFASLSSLSPLPVWPGNDRVEVSHSRLTHNS